ncbi:MAG TPA: hypothetical protein VMV92_38215 [Streptosporangiaceae bacterium]|nr:hypothetical protein [Streptosporangiaceae bacterium]
MPTRSQRNTLSILGVPVTMTALTVLGIAACGSSASHPAASTAQTGVGGTQICRELNTWAKKAETEDAPRLNAQLTHDETEAADLELGSDLASLGQALQTSNSLAIFPGSGQVAALEADCQGFGVTLSGFNS